ELFDAGLSFKKLDDTRVASAEVAVLFIASGIRKCAAIEDESSPMLRLIFRIALLVAEALNANGQCSTSILPVYGHRIQSHIGIEEGKNSPLRPITHTLFPNALQQFRVDDLLVCCAKLRQVYRQRPCFKYRSDVGNCVRNARKEVGLPLEDAAIAVSS